MGSDTWIFETPRLPTWQTRDGRVLVVSEITDDHLANIFNMLRRKCRFHYAIFDEMARRGLWEADRDVLARHEFQRIVGAVPDD